MIVRQSECYPSRDDERRAVHSRSVKRALRGAVREAFVMRPHQASVRREAAVRSIDREIENAAERERASERRSEAAGEHEFDELREPTLMNSYERDRAHHGCRVYTHDTSLNTHGPLNAALFVHAASFVVADTSLTERRKSGFAPPKMIILLL